MRLSIQGAARAALTAALVLLTGTSALASDYPSRPITMVVPFAAGGPTDTVARLISQEMSKDLGQQVIVENVGGAGGTLGAARVAKADPDGYTILLHHIGQATSATLYRKLPYDTLTDFVSIGLVTEVPMTLVAKKDFPAANLQELIEYVKKNADKVTLANAGVGAASHLCGMLLQRAIYTQLTTVPYKGTGPAMNDLVGGQVDLLCDQTTNTTGQIKGGAVKPYAITTMTRVASLPDIPTAAEAGLKEMSITVWHGVYAPKGTTDAIAERLAASLRKALASEAVISRFADLGTTPVTADRVTPKALSDHLKAEVERWRPIIIEAGLFAD